MHACIVLAGGEASRDNATVIPTHPTPTRLTAVATQSVYTSQTKNMLVYGNPKKNAMGKRPTILSSHVCACRLRQEPVALPCHLLPREYNHLPAQQFPQLRGDDLLPATRALRLGLLALVRLLLLGAAAATGGRGGAVVIVVLGGLQERWCGRTEVEAGRWEVVFLVDGFDEPLEFSEERFSPDECRLEVDAPGKLVDCSSEISKAVFFIRAGQSLSIATYRISALRQSVEGASGSRPDVSPG